jgi:ribosomal protein S18 acetylase RimI-like enzyme
MMGNQKSVSKFEIRPATEKDAPIVLALIKELAGYENLTHEVKATMEDKLLIRPYRNQDEREVIDLWINCDLVIPANNPNRDIQRKFCVNPELFLVGILNQTIVATCMAGYEGHRGWINYLAVSPQYRRQGIATQIMNAAEKRLKAAGCPKINLQVRSTNTAVIKFYECIGYSNDNVISLGKQLEPDPPYQDG